MVIKKNDHEMHKKIKIKAVLNLMMRSESIVFYEYYDGLHVNDTHVIRDNGNKLRFYMDLIFLRLPSTKLVSFKYTSRFVDEFNMKTFQGIPNTLKNMKLATFRGMNINYIKYFKENDITCHVQYEEPITDDSKTYILNDGKWMLT